jgi:hypothetical protein
MHKKLSVKKLEAAVAKFNELNPVGTAVRFWPGPKQGEGLTGTISDPATVLGGHTAVAWIDGARGCIAISHVERIDAAQVA